MSSSTVIAIFIAVVLQLFSSQLLPHGPAVDIPPNHGPHLGPDPDPSDTSLQLASGKLAVLRERVEEGMEALIVHPETVIFGDDGTMYVLSEGAKLVMLSDFRQDVKSPSTLTAKADEVAHLGVGRPLAGKFDSNGCLYYADAILGLARICLPDSMTGNTSTTMKPNVELLASRVQLDDGTWSPISYADDVDIGPKTGHVYFSDASNVRSDRDLSTGIWDIVYASKVEGMRGSMTGRLLRYKPETGKVDVLATGAAFGNGVAVDKDETYVLYTATFDRAVMKYHLTGEKAGQVERILDQFPGILDGADCSHERGTCFVAIPTSIPLLPKIIYSLPSFIGKRLRSLLMLLPRTWTPKPERYGAFAEIHPGDEQSAPSIKRIVQDPDGIDMDMITGVTEYNGKLYLASLSHNVIGVYDLD